MGSLPDNSMPFYMLLGLLAIWFVIDQFILRRAFRSRKTRMVVSYLLTGYIFCALPLTLTNPNTNAIGTIWLTVSWPAWLLFGYAPMWLIPHMFTF